LKTIAHIFTRYAAFLWAVLKPLGAWGVFAIAGIDSGLFGMPLDAVVGAYVYQDRSRMLLYIFMASLGSALGSIVIYAIGYKGGEALLRKRIAAEKFERIHQSFEKHPFWALMFPAMLPPPTPFKLFVLAAAVTEMKLWRFLLAIFAGRFVRFLILSILILKFGPGFLQTAEGLFQHHLWWVLLAIAAGLLIWLFTWRNSRRKKLLTTSS
jgi:membrane protein YqaA with SNARE-associated domain